MRDDEIKDSVELTGFPPDLNNNLCYECGIAKKDTGQDGFWCKFIEHCGEIKSVFVCDKCFNKPTLICPICKWVGNEGNASYKTVSNTTAESGYCPKCENTKCLKFDD